MPLSRLLVISSILFSLSIALAENRPKQQPKNSVSVPSPNPENTMTGAEKNAMYNFVLESLHNRRDGIFSSDSVCYTMRTYVAHTNFDKKFVFDGKPEAVSFDQPAPSAGKPGSSLIEPYTTCTPSLRFDVRTTVQPAEPVNDSR